MAPIPTLPVGTPVSGSTSSFEYALAYTYDATAGTTAVATVADADFKRLPTTGEISLNFNPQTQQYDAYVASGLDAWSYAVKTGMQATLSVKTAAPFSDPNVAPLVQAGLLSGNAAMILFRIRNGDGSYFSGSAAVGVQTSTPVRNVMEITISGPTNGKVEFTPATP